jgi:hypothetical protein
MIGAEAGEGVDGVGRRRAKEPAEQPTCAASTLGRPRFKLDRSYTLVGGLTMLFVTTYAINGWWNGDFWEHAAVVRAFAQHPGRPHNPLLLVHEPSAFFDPYSLVVGLFSRMTHIGPVRSLAIFGVVTMLAFVAAFRPFVRLFSKRPHASAIALLFTLLLWGWRPWEWSGFFDLNTVGGGMAYPSTVATTMTFAGLAGWEKVLRGRRGLMLMLVVVDAALLPLVHPAMALAFFVGAGLLWLRSPAAELRSAVGPLGLVGLAASIAVLVWPYYSTVLVLTKWVDLFSPVNKPMYEGLLTRGLPALAGVPFVVRRLRNDARDGLSWFLAGLTVLYIYGGVSGDYDLGRMLSFIIMLLHIALADGLLGWWQEATPARRLAARRPGLPVLAAVFVFELVNLAPGFARTIPSTLIPSALARHMPPRPYAHYGSALAGVGADDVVLATDKVAWAVPAFGGKIVSTLDPQAFVADQGTRSRDVSTFFDSRTAMAERSAILERYRVSFILWDDADPTPGVAAGTFMEIAQPVRTVGSLHLLRVSAGA